MAGRSGRDIQALRKKKKEEQTGSTTKKSQSSVSQNKNGGGRTGGLTKQQVQQKVSRSAGYTSSGKAKQPAQTQKTNPYATTRNIVNRSNNSKAPERASRTSNRINSSNTRGREQAPIDRRQTFATAVEMREARENERLKRNPAPTAKKMLEEREKNKDSKFAETVKNTGSASKKGLLDAASGHAQAALDTLSGLTSNEQRNYTWLRAAELSAGIDNKAETRKAAKGTLETSKQLDEERKKLNAEQEKRQEEFDKKTKNSSGLQKAIYGAAESGTGMATDLAIGRLTGTGQAGSLASMFSRTYGTTRGQAEKEGATENEDRLYAGLQAVKEVGTELMFPGVGLAKGFVGKGGIKAGERFANALTKNMRGKAADVAYAGLRMLGGTAEENAEELAGWGLDPFIKDIAYGRNVRARAKESLMSDLPEITSREQAEALTARLNSDSYVNELAAEFKANGLGDKEAKDLATKMRDFYAAYYSGDTEKADEIGDDLAGDLTGVKKISKESFSTSELRETIEATTLLTATTGLPGTISTAQRGDQIKQGLKADGLKALAKEVMNSEDAEASERGKIAQAALESGKDITSTQAYDLEQGLYQQQEKDVKRQIALIDTASKQADENGYVAPYTIDEYGRITSMEKATRTAYNEAAESASETLDHVDTKESLTDIDKAYGARAIAGFKTGAFTVDDANTIVADETIKDAFKAETGIDLGQYEVKNRDGSINIPKTNAATKDALFAMATDNLVKMAETETANWKDVTKGETLRQVTARMGAKGGVAAQLVLNDVDERDTMQYRTMTAVSDYVYQSALNLGVSWEDAKDSITSQFSTIPEEKLRTLYDAGLADRQASTDKMLGLQTKIGEAMSKSAGRVDPTKGNLFIETEETPGSSATEVFRGIAESLGIDIYIVDDLPIKDSDRQANGQYIKGDIYINVNSTFEENLGFIFMHEVTHHLKQYAPEQYKALENLVREEWFKANPEDMMDRIARKIKTYEDAGQTLTEEEALEEIIADSTHEFLMDKNFAEQVSKKDPSLAKAVLSAIKNLLRKLRQIFSSGNYASSKTQMDSIFKQLGIMEEAEKLWLDAYTEAVKNKAAVGLVEWQDKVFEESRNSVGYHAGDLGKSTADDFAHQGYGRGTGHFGFGTYFVGDQAQIGQGSGYGSRPVETVDFDKYNLARPRNEEMGFKLHDALKRIDGFIQDYSEFAKYTDILNRTEEASRRAFYITSRVHSDLDDITWDLYEGNEPNPERKDRVDQYVESLPQDYKDAIEEKTAEYIDRDNQRAGTMDDLGLVNERNSDEYWRYEAIADIAKEYEEDWQKEYDKFQFLVSDIRHALNYAVSEADIEEALKKTEEIVKGYQPNGGYRLDAEPGLDSGATVFMKQLGYEGVDVRHLPRLDNTGYGSVIYDLKDEDLARKQEIGTARFSISYTPEEMDAHRQYLIDTATDFYDEPYTEDINESGFIFPDGKLPRMGMYGSRADDHALVVGAYDDIDYATSQRPKTEAMARFLNEGNIRYMPENGSIELGTEIEPTPEQYDRIRQMDYVNMIEFTSPDGENVDYKEYDGDRSGVVNDIKRFYRDGEIGGSQLSQFRYSITTTADYKIGETLGDEPVGVFAEAGEGNAINVRYSIPTEINAEIKGDGRVISVRLMRDGFMKGRGKERKAVNAFIDALGDHMVKSNDLYKYISLSDVQNATVTYRKDADGNPTSVIMSCQVQNGEYEINYDFSTICKKRKAFQDLIETFFRKTDMDTLDLTEENIFKINQVLESYGFEVACPICFVEARRYANQEYADKIVNTWNAEVEKINPDAEYFDFANSDPSTFDYVAIDEALKKVKITEGMDFADKCRELVKSGAVFQKKMQQSDILTNNGIIGMKAMSNEDKNLFGYMKGSRGASAPKEIVSFNAYNGEIEALKDTYNGMPLDKFLYTIGGARLQSFSDFQIENVYDYIQLIAGFAARKLPAHAYTKEVAFAKLFGMTGMKINLSLVCDVDPNVDDEHAGLTKNEKGEWVYNLGSQSFDMEAARELQADKRYSKNVGTIMVGLSDAHIWMALDDPDVRYIIPYHKSGLPNVIQAVTNLAKAEDYTKYQNTCMLSATGIKKLKAAGYETDVKAIFEKNGKNVKKTLAEINKNLQAVKFTSNDVRKASKLVPKQGSKTGEMVEKKLASTGDFNVYDDVAVTKNPRKTAENYCAYCFENGYIPLFFEFAGHKNYYKMIFDFNVYDSVSGRYAPQGAVKNIYPGCDLTKGETDYSGLFNENGWQKGKENGLIDEYLHERDKFHEKQDPKIKDVITEVKENILTDLNLRDEDEEVRWSLSDDAKDMDALYMDAVNSGNMDEAQRLVDEAAKKAGYGTRLYHGTQDFGFTRIVTSDLESNSDGGYYDWSPFFATDSLDVAQTYSSTNDIKRISEAEEPFDEYAFEDDYYDAVSDAISAVNEFAETYNYLDYDVNPFRKAYEELQNSSYPIGQIIEGLEDEIGEMISEIAWQKAGDESEDRFGDISDLADEIQESEAANRIWEELGVVASKLRQYDRAVYGDSFSGNYDLFANTDNLMEVDAKGKRWNNISYNRYAAEDTELTPYEEIFGATDDTTYNTRQLARIAREQGYPGIKISNVFDDGGKGRRQQVPATVYIFFEPEKQIKSADPVTYAEDGSVIPLSERFDPTNPDIRYSLPTQDSDGNILTNGQMDYFKNSQARDEQGRLVPVYHTTNKGGFTVFDPSYSDDKRSLFFASNWDVSQTYGNYANSRFYKQEISTLDDVKKFLDAYSPDRYFITQEQFKQAGGWEADFVDFENVTKGEQSDFEQYLENPDGYIAIIGVPDHSPDHDSYSDDWIRADSPNEIPNEIRNHMNFLDANYFGKERGYYACYLNLENPMIVDANGDYWNAIHYDDDGVRIQDDAIYKFNQIKITHNEEGINLLIFGESKDADELWSNFKVNESFDDTDGLYEYLLYTIGLDDNYVEDIFALANKEGNVNYWAEDYIGANGDLLDEEDYSENTYNTRQIASIAESLGHDGVIIRNLIDHGGKSAFDGIDESSDIYIAFSSNQVKDVGNENPTENPDIRYSIPPEDETMSDIAYEDSIDDSFDELAKYEMMLDESKFTDNMLSKPFDEEQVSRFYSGLKAWEPRVYNDPVLEEDAVRVAKSKADFYNNLNAKWQDRWTTEGEVLKVSSVRTDIRNLVKGVMNNSDTSAQYKTEIVNKTLIDARIAFQLMKQDRTDVASALLYHSAQRMIENVEFIQDDMFKQYKDLRDYLRTTRISLGEEYWSDVDYDAFRKRNMNKIKLVKGDTNVDTIYQEMCDLWPEWFEEEEDMTPPDMLLQMEHVLEAIQPYKEAYSSEAATELCYDIADELYEIIAGGQEVRSLADTYKAKFDAKTKEMKLNHQEALRKAREERDKGIKAERAKWKVKEEARKEKRLHDKYFESIAKSHKTLVDRLRTNTKDKHIPEQYKKDLAGLLAAFDFQTVRSKEREAKTYHRSKNAIKMSAIRTALRQIEASSELFHINDSITDIIDELLGENSAQPKARTIEGKTLDELSAEELKRIDNLMKALVHEFNTYESVRTGAKRQQAADIGHTQNNTSLEHAKIFGAGRDFRNLPGAVDKLINLDEMTAAYMFRRVDPEGTGIGLMWKQIRRSFDRYVRNQDQLNKWIEEIVGEYHQKGILWNKYGSGELTKWRSENSTQTFNLTNGSVDLTPAQMMSIYCLARRRQAKGHMVADGIVVAPVSFQAKITSDLKHKAQTNLPVKLTDADINQIVAALTPDQVKVADKLQQLMATKMADWGNEASMSVIGIKLFEEPDYFPIRSDKAGLTKDLDEGQFVQAIRNFGFTKATQPNARNAIMVEDIFDVVAEHCNNMNLYNSYSEAMNDFMKVYNYKEEREEEGTYSVEQALAHAYSSKATTFIMTLMKDLNGNVSGASSGIESFFNTSLANAKKASVFANFRVAAQQPTAIMRAFAEIDPKYIKGISLKDTVKGAIPFAKKEIMDEMFEHCPIALWKSWGYYDINMGKSIEDLMMNNGNWLEDKATDIYGALDNVTWTAIWQMVKAETKDKHPNVKEGSDEFFEMCNERMSEIVDLTQVVDSPLHRSHAMRKKDFFNKLTTSFMAEPTLTFNMFKDGMIRASEAWKQKDVKTAGKIFGKTIAVFLLQAGTVAAAAALIDALRNKNPNGDDDDDERFLHLWWVNTIENFWDNVKPWNNIYVVKDIASMFEGWENRNLALQGWNYLATGWRQLMGDSYVKSTASWWENFVYGFGYITGVPTKTMLTGMKNAASWLGIDLGMLDTVGEKLDGVAKEPEKASSKASSEKKETKAQVQASAELPTAHGKHLKGYEEEAEKIAESVADKTGEEREKATWKKVSEYIKEQEGLSVEELVAEGRLNVLEDYRDMYTGAGNSDAYFNERILKYCKSEYKKTINYDPSNTQSWVQGQMKQFMTENGMTDEDVSAMVYKSETAKDLKVAMRIGDQELIQESLTPLAAAGITQADLDKLWDNRNRVDLKKYKDKGGRYASKLKSMGTFIWPTKGVVTSHFGYRNSPTAGASSNHPAIDIGASQGTPVVAADGGVVIYAGNNGGYGNSVGIKHDNGMVTYYNHLYAWNVKVGDTVGQGQQIAQVGSTGISTGPHLDFKILDKNGKPVDPEKYLN